MGQVVLGGDNVSPLVEIGLTDPPKSGGAAAPPASPLVACLHWDFIIGCIKPNFSRNFEIGFHEVSKTNRLRQN